MKNIVKAFLGIMGFLWYLFYNQKTSRKLTKYKNFIFSYWVKNAFGKAGKDFYVARPFYLLGGENIFVGNNFACLKGMRIETYNKYNGTKFNPKLIIGDNFCANFDCHIGCVEKIEIGNNVLLASRVFITDSFHGKTDTLDDLKIPPGLRILYTKGSVIIEDNVWIGEGAVILPGVRIGKGSVIGANAVVTKNIPPYSIAAGIPANVIKKL